MLKPLEPYDGNDIFFVVSDIETYAKPRFNEGEVIAIDTCFRNASGEIEHKRHGSWGGWWDWLVYVAERDDRFRVVYAHNGGGFDWLSLLEKLLSETKPKYHSISAACAGSKMITLGVKISENVTIHLCDSLQLLRSKLDKLAEIFCGKRKVELNGKLPHEVFEENPEKFFAYHKRDTETLLEVMENALRLVRDNIAGIKSFGFTVGSTALKTFRTMGMDKSISIPREKYLCDFLRLGYRGGRVEAFNYGYNESVKVYDINSLYPSIMHSCKVPITGRGFWTEKFWPDEIGIYEITFNQRNRQTVPVLCRGGNGVYEGSGCYYSPEINLLLEIDPHAEIVVKRGFCFSDCEIIFRSFVDTLYTIRKNSPPDGPLSLLCKYFMNSLYGKFGQHAERETIVSGEGIENILDKVPKIGPSNIRPIDAMNGVWGITNKVNCDFEHVGIAGIITSESRVKLYRGINYVVEKLGFESLLYVDTDSLHIGGGRILGAEFCGKELGQFKLEFEGEGVYAGKKLYGLREKSGQEKIRAKGVSVGGNFGCKLKFDDLIKISNGEKLECEFEQFTTPMSVLKGEKSCRLKKRKRTLKRI